MLVPGTKEQITPFTYIRKKSLYEAEIENAQGNVQAGEDHRLWFVHAP